MERSTFGTAQVRQAWNQMAAGNTIVRQDLIKWFNLDPSTQGAKVQAIDRYLHRVAMMGLAEVTDKRPKKYKKLVGDFPDVNLILDAERKDVAKPQFLNVIRRALTRGTIAPEDLATLRAMKEHRRPNNVSYFITESLIKGNLTVRNVMDAVLRFYASKEEPLKKLQNENTALKRKLTKIGEMSTDSK